MHPAMGSGQFKLSCRLSLASDLRWSTMIFITHLIVNERNCNQQLLSILYMESRRLLSPEKMWLLTEARRFLLPPLFLGGDLKEERRVTHKTVPALRLHCCHSVSCSESLGLTFWLNSISLFRVQHFLAALPYANWGYSLHTLSSQVKQRNRLKE